MLICQSIVFVLLTCPNQSFFPQVSRCSKISPPSKPFGQSPYFVFNETSTIPVVCMGPRSARCIVLWPYVFFLMKYNLFFILVLSLSERMCKCCGPLYFLEWFVTVKMETGFLALGLFPHLRMTDLDWMNNFYFIF